MDNFDFFVGSWASVQRRLAKPLAGCADWDEFKGTTQAMTFLDGGASVDEVTFPEKGFSGLTLRIFDKERQQWSIYWFNSRNPVMGEPQVGRFDDGVGFFYGDDTYDDQPIRVRFRWFDITPTSAKWEQAFSTDGEKTWEANWTAEFTRSD
jgi:hypothetical protein